MKGFVFSGPGKGEVRTLPDKMPGPGEVLVKVAFCGICGTDMNIWRGTDHSARGIVPGHEYCGTVVETGMSVRSHRIGDRVSIDPNIPCGCCEYCRKGRINLCENLKALGVDIDGGFAQYCVVPETQLYDIPDGMTFEEAALLEPLACALNGINRIRIDLGDDVLILGGGPMGLMMLQLARMKGAGKVILCERLEGRRTLAGELGADLVIDDADKVEEVLGRKPDAVIECIGSPGTQAKAFELVRKGGNVQLFGDGDMTRTFSLPSMICYEKELKVTGAALNPFTHAQALKVAASKRVNLLPLISGRIPIEKLKETLDRGYGKDDVKILVAWE